MFPAPFDYYRATSVANAVQLLQQHRGAKLLAGGHSLLPLLKLRLGSFDALVDIGRVSELRGIAVRDGRARIGALTTHAELATSTELAGACPIIPQTAALIGDPQVRNRATIGGNIAHADPASDLPTVLAALEARILVTGRRGQRTINASDFFQGLFSTALAENEVITSVEVARRQDGEGTAYVKFAHPASRFAVLGVAAIVRVSGGRCVQARVALGGLVPAPVRAASVERALVGGPLTAERISAAAAVVDGDLGDSLLGDVFASAEYRRAMAPVYVRKALEAAAQAAAAR